MLFMAVFHPGPRGFIGQPVPLLMQHGPTPGVTVHNSWQGAGFGTETPGDARRYVLFECAAEQVTPFIGYMRPYFEAIEVRNVAAEGAISQYRAAEARNPEILAAGANQTEAQRRDALANARRYMSTATPAEAMGIWVETQENGPRAVVEEARGLLELG